MMAMRVQARVPGGLPSRLRGQHSDAAHRRLRAPRPGRLLAFVLMTSFLSLAHVGAVWAAGDPAAGKEKAATCAACHGAEGVSKDPSNPILAGQYDSYIQQALKSYRSGARENAIMAGFATQLSDQDIADLAAWYSSQNGPLRVAPRD